MSKLISLLVLLGVSFGTSFARDTAPADLLSLDSAFAAGEYERAELLGLRFLQGQSDLSPMEIARISLTVGYALIMQSREREARAFFARALDADSTLELDPVQVSPKFRMVFEEVKAERERLSLRKDSDPAPTEKAETVKSFRVKPRSLALNLFLPGTGHWREGHALRGAIFFGLQAVTVGATLSAIRDTRDARSVYLSATDPAEIARTYEDYNHNYQAAWIWGIATGAVYLTSQLDLIRIGADHPSEKETHAQLKIDLDRHRVGLQLVW